MGEPVAYEYLLSGRRASRWRHTVADRKQFQAARHVLAVHRDDELIERCEQAIG